MEDSGSTSRGMVDGIPDVTDLIGIGGVSGQLHGSDVDQGVQAATLRKRMQACLQAARMRMEARPEETEAAVGALINQAAQATTGMAEMQEFSEEQATNQLLFSMILSCYHSIDSSSVDQIRAGGRLSADEDEAIFKQSASPPRPTRKQFRLLESVMNEQRVKEMSEVNPGDVSGVNILGRGMSARAKVFYVVVVSVVLVGAVLWAFHRVSRPRQVRERTTKAMRRVTKAELRLDKKKQG